MKNCILLSTVFLLFIISSCKFFPTDLPKKPDKFEITWSVDGGSLYRFESIFISKDSCVYNLNKGGRKQVINFTLPQESLDNLYQVFYDNEFDKIDTYDEDEVYDRGGTSIKIDVDDKEFSVSNSGRTFLKKGSEKSYHIIETEFKNITFKEINKYKVLTNIKLDTSITNSKYNVMLYVNENMIYEENNDGNYITINLPIFKMNNKFEIYFREKKPEDSYPKNVDRFDVVLNELGNNKEITLILENNNLSIK